MNEEQIERLESIVIALHEENNSFKKNVGTIVNNLKNQAEESIKIIKKEKDDFYDYKERKIEEIEKYDTRLTNNRTYWIMGVSVCAFIAMMFFFHYQNSQLDKQKTLIHQLTDRYQKAVDEYSELGEKYAFGATTVKTDDGYFVTFDERYQVGECNLTNCVSIKEKE